MNRRILGFQRRVWWPKWTPASSKSSNVGCPMHSLSWVRSAAALISDATPRGDPAPDQATCVIYRLLNWNRLRAPARPGFFRSTTRGSRVSSPCSRSFLRCRSSARHSARAIASRIAPACPVTPPPRHSARTSKAPSVSVAVNGCGMCDTSDGRGKESPSVRPLTFHVPEPARRRVSGRSVRPVRLPRAAFPTPTQPPPFRCGGNVGLCLPRRIGAPRLASRPSGSPAASTTNQRRVTSSFRSVNVFIPSLPNGNPVGDSRELYPSRKGLSTRGFRAREGHERGAFFDRLTNRNMDCLHRPRARRAQLVLHFHRLHDHESSAGIHPLTLGDFDPHHQTGHRCAHRPAAGGGLALGADRLASALALVLHQHLHPLPHHPQRPPPNALQRLRPARPPPSPQQQMIEGRPPHRRE